MPNCLTSSAEEAVVPKTLVSDIDIDATPRQIWQILSDPFAEAAAAFEAAVDGSDDPLTAFVAAYRAFASAHPHVYRLMTTGPLPREHLPPGLEARAAAPLLRAVGSPARARAAWAFIHGMTILELDARFPSDQSTEPAWQEDIAAFRHVNRAGSSRTSGARTARR